MFGKYTWNKFLLAIKKVFNKVYLMVHQFMVDQLTDHFISLADEYRIYLVETIRKFPLEIWKNLISLKDVRSHFQL